MTSYGGRSLSRGIEVGVVIISEEAQATLSPDEIARALRAHASCNWEFIWPEDREANERALLYDQKLGAVFWDQFCLQEFEITTNSERTETFICLVSEVYSHPYFLSPH